MAADKEIMKAIETLCLDRPGRVYQKLAAVQHIDPSTPGDLTAALRELAATYREEAELWSRSGAKGWKGSEAEKYLVAQHIDDVAGQLDNAGGGAALSVSRDPMPMWCGAPDVHAPHSWAHADGNIGTVHCGGGNLFDADDTLEAELRQSAKRVDAVRDLAGLDKLIADSVAAGKGHVRDAAQAADFGQAPESVTITGAFGPYERDGRTHTDAETQRRPLSGLDEPGLKVEIGGNDVTAYLSGAVDTLPGLQAALVPGSIPRQPEAGNPFGSDEGAGTVIVPAMANEPVGPYSWDTPDLQERLRAAGPVEIRSVADTSGITPVRRAKLDSLKDHPIPFSPSLPAVPTTWESETMTADGHRPPGAPVAPLLGQPGDAGAGYSHTYIPAGGRRFTYAELLTPVPATALPGHLSHSQGNTIGDCAAKYRLQRIEQLPQVPQWANVGGSAFHAWAEDLERGVIASNPNEDRLAMMWKHYFEEQIRIVSASSPVPVSVWRAARKGAEGRQWWEVNGPLMLRRYLDARPAEHTANLPTNTGEFGPGAFQSAIELDLTVDVPTPYGPVPFKAVLDRVTNAPQPGPDSPESNWITLVIRDYKTSYERPTDTTQLGEYAHALRLWGVPESVRILGTYFDARRGEWTPPVDLLQAHPFEAFQYRVTAAHGQKRALTVGPTPARPSSYCGGCSVRYACPIMATKS